PPPPRRGRFRVPRNKPPAGGLTRLYAGAYARAMTNNDTTATIFSAIYATLQSWAGSIDEHGLADGTATVTEEYIEYPADSPLDLLTRTDRAGASPPRPSLYCKECPMLDLQAAQEAVDVAQEALQAATRDRDAAVQAAYADGVPVPQIAAQLGVHRQIVYRII